MPTSVNEHKRRRKRISADERGRARPNEEKKRMRVKDRGWERSSTDVREEYYADERGSIGCFLKRLSINVKKKSKKK